MGLRGRDAARLTASVVILAGAAALALWIWRAGAPRENGGRSNPLPRSDRPLSVGLATLTGPEETRANNLGVELATAGRHEEAMPYFEHAVSESPDYLPGHKNLLAACVETGRWEEALVSALRVEELHPLKAELRLPVPPLTRKRSPQVRQVKEPSSRSSAPMA